MRKMHPIIVDCVKTLDSNLGKAIKQNNEVEIKKFMSNFTIDVIASCAFGTKIDTYSDPNNVFIVNAKNAFGASWRALVFFTLATISPTLITWMKFSFVDPSVTKFFESAVSLLASNFQWSLLIIK